MLIPGGLIQISVPDLATSARIILDPKSTWRDHHFILGLMYGLQEDAYDFYKIGLTGKLLSAFLEHAGFSDIKRVKPFGIFNDWSGRAVNGHLISLNMEARKPSAPANDKKAAS